MARRTATPAAQSTTSAATTEESTVTATLSPSEQSTLATDTDTTPEAAVEQATAAVVEKAAEKEIDLSGFESAVALALESRDPNTGDITAEDAQPATEAYRALDGQKAKNRAKDFLQAGMKAGLESSDIILARAYNTLGDLVTAAPVKTSTAAPRVPTDPTEAFVERVVAQNLALDIVKSNTPDGVSDDWSDKASALIDTLGDDVTTYGAYLDAASAWSAADEAERGEEPEAPEVSPVVVAAFKLASGRGSGLRLGTRRTAASSSTPAYSGPRRDIAAHIIDAFADLPSGSFLTISEIRKHKSSEYDSNVASAGAISARLFPASGKKANIEGVSATYTGGESGDKRGAIKD